MYTASTIPLISSLKQGMYRQSIVPSISARGTVAGNRVMRMKVEVGGQSSDITAMTALQWVELDRTGRMHGSHCRDVLADHGY